MSEIEYRFTIWPMTADEGGGYLIEFPDLPGCMSDGETIEEAVVNGTKAKSDWIAAMIAAGRPVPPPLAGATVAMLAQDVETTPRLPRYVASDAMVADNLPEEMRNEALNEIETAHMRGFFTLLAGLTMATEEAHEQGAEDGGRKSVLRALASVCIFLEGFPRIKRLSLHAPLIGLCEALDDLDTNGVQHPMFQRDKGKNTLPSDRAKLHALAAVWATLLIKNRTSPSKAYALVARAMSRYRMRGERGNHPTPATVREWRKQSRQSSPVGLDASVFQHMLKIFQDHDVAALNAGVPAAMRNLLPHLFD